MKERIREVRKFYGLTQTEFGEKLCVAQATVAGWENSSRNPTDSIISLICKVYNVNEHWLRTGEGEMIRPDNKEDALMEWVGTVLADESESFRRRFLNLLVQLTPEDWEKMEDFARFLLGDRFPEE